MIDSGHTFADSRLHQSGEGRKHVDWRVDLSVVKVSVDEDLSFGDITGQIWDRMGDIIVRHSQNRQLGDGSVLACHSTGSLVDGGQIGVHVTWIRSSTWHFLSCGRDFSQCIGV